MPLSIIETCRKRKRRPKIFGLHSFGDVDCPMNLTGVFRDNVRVFLQECAELEDYSVQGMPVWCTLLHHESKSMVLPLYTIEENVKESLQPYCDHCRCAGWSNHFVSKRKYHLIIPTDREWHTPLDDDVLDLQTHLLHGLIHSNGFGHLICINGIEGGSKSVCGREIMDLWDRICTNLHVRKITVVDLSKKRSMELRLLYGVAYGHSWFGKWGYKFHRGSHGVNQHNYERAIEMLGSLELSKIISDFSSEDNCSEIKQIIQNYRETSEAHLTTLRDLLRFMLTVKSCSLPQKSLTMFDSTLKSTVKRKSTAAKDSSPKYKRFSSVVANMDTRWPARRLEYAADVIVEALKEKKFAMSGHGGMTRQDVRDAARIHIGDTGLLDNVLKSMNNVIVGRYVVRRALNPATRILQYTIHELGNDAAGVEKNKPIPQEPLPAKPSLVPGADVYRDLVYVYTGLLSNYPKSEMELASQAILDSKHFVKEWPFNDEKVSLLGFVCHVSLSLFDLRLESIKEPPGVLVFVPLQATVSELKQAAADALRDTYCIMENFVVTDIDNLEESEDGEFVFDKFESGTGLVVRGYGVDLESELKFEGGCDTWMVRCECGARDDDGERMVACDICEVWQHTRCCGIDDSEIMPPLFLCATCCDSFATKRTEQPFDFESCDDLFLSEVATFGKECLAVLL